MPPIRVKLISLTRYCAQQLCSVLSELRGLFVVFASFEFAESDNVLRLTLSGEATDDAILGLWSKGTDIGASFPSCRTIVDLSGISRLDVSTRAIETLARRQSLDLPTRVFVAPVDSIYGAARMFQVLSENTRKNIHVVRTMDEAYKVLGIESPKFTPVAP